MAAGCRLPAGGVTQGRGSLARETERLGRLRKVVAVPEILDCGGDDRLSRSLTATVPGTPLDGQPGLHHAARERGIRHALPASPVRQLGDMTRTTLLRTSPDETITLTADGEQFASDVRPVLESCSPGRSSTAITERHPGTSQNCSLTRQPAPSTAVQLPRTLQLRVFKFA